MNSFSLHEKIENVSKQVIQWRQHLHQYPELSFHEFETANFISKQLQNMSHIEVSHPTKTSVMGRLKGKKGTGKTIALRADIDALPIHEQTNLPFASKHDGKMHACGHDGHTAILLGTANILNDLHDDLVGNYIFLFQHAEEVPPGGAKEMVQAGVLKDVDYVLGLHLWSTVPTGEIHITEGPITAASDLFDIKVEGKSGHASQPESAIDALAIGAQIVTNLQQIVSRNISPLDSGVVSVTRFHSGDAYNVIPDTAHIGGSVRALTNEVREQLRSKIEQISTQIAGAHDAKVTLNYDYGYDPVNNNLALTENIFNFTKQHFKNDDHIKILQAPPMLGGEDFSAFSNVVPGCYVGIGAKKQAGEAFPHHHPQFEINEEAFTIALQYYLSNALQLNGML